MFCLVVKKDRNLGKFPKCKLFLFVFFVVQVKFNLAVDLSSVNVECTNRATMTVNEDFLSNENALDLLCDIIDKEIEKTHPNWRNTFAVTNASNDESILSTIDLVKMLELHNDAGTFDIFLKMKPLGMQTPGVQSCHVEAELNKLNVYQSYWNDSNHLSKPEFNCDKEIDFIFGNLQNIKEKLKKFAKENESNLQIITEKKYAYFDPCVFACCT